MVPLCVFHTGFLDSEPLREADEDFVSEVNLSASMTEEEREEIQQELAKVNTHTHKNTNISLALEWWLFYLGLWSHFRSSVSFCACPAGRGDRHTEAGFVFQREAACGAQTETGHHSSERAQNQLQQRLARHAELSSVSYSTGYITQLRNKERICLLNKVCVSKCTRQNGFYVSCKHWCPS